MSEYTEGQILDRLIEVGIIDREWEQSINARSSFTVRNGRVRVTSELFGMGHNEPRSYGTRLVCELLLDLLFDTDFDYETFKENSK